MPRQQKVIITCAVTGGIHTPSMSPHLPVSAKDIEEAAVGAIEAGGRKTFYKAVKRARLDLYLQQCSAP